MEEADKIDDFVPHKIMDFSEKLNENNKEENMNKETNIPTTPIIEDIPEIKPIDVFNLNNEKVPEEPIVEEKKTNAGFMDIDKIEKEAQDIYHEKPVADLDMLLNVDKKDDIKEEEKEPVVEEPKETQQNKFFNFNFDDLDESSDGSSAVDSKTEKNDIELEKPKEAQDNEVSSPDISTFDFNSFFNPIDESKENNNVIKDDDFLEPEKKENNRDVDVIDFDDDFLNLNNDESKEVVEDNNLTKTEPLIQENKIEEKAEEQQNQQYETTSANDKVVEENPTNLRLAINTIRNCSKELKNLGYILDLEELDFEDTYQVTFKINKN